MLHGGKLVRIDVESDARSSMAHLRRHRHDVGASANEMTAERVSQIMEREPGLPLRIESRTVGRLRQTSLCEVAVVQWGARGGRKDEVVLSRKATLKRVPTVLAEQGGELREKDYITPSSTSLEFDECRGCLLGAASELMADGDDTASDRPHGRFR
jgi:hypothetical protein